MSVFNRRGNPIPPEQLIAMGRCPETGVELFDLDIEGHITATWPRDRCPDALARINMLRGYARQRAADADKKAAATPARS